MRRKTTIFVTAFLLAILCGCTGGDMLAELERLEEQNRSDQPFTSDSAARRIVDYYDRWYRIPTAANHNLQMRAYYMLGSAYRDMGEAPKALEYFQHAAEIADTTSKDCDFDRLMRIHSQMSELYASQRLLDEEQIELDNAEQLAWRIKDTLSALIFEEYKCHSLYNKGKYKKCIEKTIELSQRYREYGYLEESLLAYTYCINSCLGLGDYSRMRSFIEQYEHCSYLHNAPQKVTGGPSALYIFKGQYYLGTQRPDSAVYFFNKALPYIHKGTGELLAYKGLFQSYNLQHKADSVLKYTQLYSDAKERNFNFEVTEATLRTKSLYDYTQEQNIAKQKLAEVARLRNFILFCILMSVMCMVVTIFIMYLHEKKKREFRELQQEHQRATNTMLDLEENLKILKAEHVSNTSTISVCIQNIEKQKNHIAYLEQALLSSGGKDSRTKLEESDIVKRFRLACIPTPRKRVKIKREDWMLLRDAVEKIYPHFYDLMNGRRQLSIKDYRVCLLTMANFSAFDVDNLMEQQPSYASVAKKRLHTKVFGYEGSAAEFDQKLHQG